MCSPLRKAPRDELPAYYVSKFGLIKAEGSVPRCYLTCTGKALELLLCSQLSTLRSPGEGPTASGTGTRTGTRDGVGDRGAALLLPNTQGTGGRAGQSAETIPSKKIRSESGPLLAVIKKHSTFNRSLFN